MRRPSVGANLFCWTTIFLFNAMRILLVYSALLGLVDQIVQLPQTGIG